MSPQFLREQALMFDGLIFSKNAEKKAVRILMRQT